MTVAIIWSCDPRESDCRYNPVDLRINLRANEYRQQIDYDGYDDFYKVKSKEYRFSNSSKNSDSEFGEL